MKTKYKFLFLIILACLSTISIYYLADKVKPVDESENLISIQYKLEEKFLYFSGNRHKTSLMF